MGGHFELESGAHFKLELGGQYHWNLHIIVQETTPTQTELVQPEWLKSKAVKKLLDISAGSVQNLRVTQKVRFKKVLGSYYYNKEDLQKLFNDESDK